MSYGATAQGPLVATKLPLQTCWSFPTLKGLHMHSTLNTHRFALAIGTASLALGGCSGMSRSEVSTATGAAVGAVAGAAVGGAAATVGGAVIGGVIGHEVDKKK